MIVFPAIDLRLGRCVRLRQGRAADETVYDDDPAAVAHRWVAQGAQWLHVVDLDAALSSDASRITNRDSPHTPNLRRLSEIHAAVPATPIQFGGGVRSLAAIETALGLGATRVVLGTAAVEDPDLVAAAVGRFGAARIVAGIDARGGQVATHGWQQASEFTAAELGLAMRRQGLIRAVYTDIVRDGTLSGVNVEATGALARDTGLRVIASGGVASLDDVVRLAAHAAAGIEGVIIGKALYTGALSLPEAIAAAAPTTHL
jgi:phosphoribosylformimino-5-aminoimidazole carboxamide ribotide isomerase